MNELNSIDEIKRFTLGGNATLTIMNMETGNRFTFRIRSPKDAAGESPHFVSVLTGADNDDSYTFLGTIFADGKYRHGRKSRIGMDAPSEKVFAWFWRYVSAARQLPTGVVVHHAGRCGRCGRTLTVTSSTARGFGPDCAEMIGAA